MTSHHGRRPRDITGQVFGRLTAVSMLANYCPSGTGGKLWVCKCTCGGQKIVKLNSLVHGYTRSCGCLKRENARAIGQAYRAKTMPRKEKSRRHPRSKTLWSVWT